MTIPAPAGIRVYFQQPGSAIPVKPPVKAGVVAAVQAFEQLDAAGAQESLNILRQVSWNRGDIPLG